MPLQPYLVQNFALIFQTEILFEELVQNFELKRVGGAPKRHKFASLIYLYTPMQITYKIS